MHIERVVSVDDEMDAEKLPDEFDAIILGTGKPENYSKKLTECVKNYCHCVICGDMLFTGFLSVCRSRLSMCVFCNSFSDTLFEGSWLNLER